MFVNIGTITAAENEAQLAGVMAHEMAHVYMQHSAKQQQKSSGGADQKPRESIPMEAINTDVSTEGNGNVSCFAVRTGQAV